jgi:hypothetical protein
VQQQHGGGKQRGDGVCSAELVAAARWQHRQSGGGSAAVAWRRWAEQKWLGYGGQRGAAGGGRAVAAAGTRWRHWQRGAGVGSAVAALAEAAQQQLGGSEHPGDGICSAAEALPAQGRWHQHSGGNDGGGGSSAAVSSGEAG